MKKAGQLSTSHSSAPLSVIELHLRSPPIRHDLIQIPLILHRIIQTQRLIPIMIVHPPVIAAPNLINQTPHNTKQASRLLKIKSLLHVVFIEEIFTILLFTDVVPVGDVIRDDIRINGGLIVRSRGVSVSAGVGRQPVSAEPG